MITTTAAYKTAVSEYSRRLVSKALVYFDGDAATPITFIGDNIVSFGLLEEVAADSSTPLGAVSSNEFELTLNNESRDFTPTNASGAYYGKLHPNTLVEPFLCLETASGVFEDIPLGSYRTSDWKAPASSIEATTICHDRLYELGARDVPELPVLENTTATEMLTVLFHALGLSDTEFIIDSNITAMTIRYGWFSSGKVLAALQAFSISVGCSIFVNRYNKIRVMSNLTSSESVLTIDDDKQIINAETIQSYTNTYSGVDIVYSTASTARDTTLLTMTDVVIPVGGTTLSRLAFTTTPAFDVSQIVVSGAESAVVTEIAYGAFTISLSFSNTGSAAETIGITVIGRPIELVENTCSAVDAALQALIGDSRLTINTPLIQLQASAELYAAQVLKLVKDPTAYIDVTLRGDPSLELMDTVTIDDAAEKIENVAVITTRHNIDFTGGALSMSMSTIRRSTRL